MRAARRGGDSCARLGVRHAETTIAAAMLLRGRIEPGIGVFGGPGIPAALDAIDPGELFSPQRPVDSAAGDAPTGAGLFVFERGRIRGDVVRVEGQFLALELRTERGGGTRRAVPEHGYLLAAERIRIAGAVDADVERVGLDDASGFDAQHGVR